MTEGMYIFLKAFGGFAITLVLLVLIYELFIRRKRNKSEWIYGTCNGTKARKSRKKGNVQMFLHKAGTQGHTEDYWHNLDSSWWELFKADEDAVSCSPGLLPASIIALVFLTSCCAIHHPIQELTNRHKCLHKLQPELIRLWKAPQTADVVAKRNRLDSIWICHCDNEGKWH